MLSLVGLGFVESVTNVLMVCSFTIYSIHSGDMIVDIEKLKSIIRLANNNPNEHEANLAARKACKILAENDFVIFKPVRTAADKLNQHASNYSGTWADVKRSTEPFWKSSPPDKSGWDPFEDLLRRARQARNRDNYERYWDEANKNPIYDPIYDASKDAYSYDGGKTWKPKVTYDQEGKRVKRSEIKKCTKCGVEVPTYRYKEEPFVCTVCHWKDV